MTTGTVKAQREVCRDFYEDVRRAYDDARGKGADPYALVGLLDLVRAGVLQEGLRAMEVRGE